MRPTILGWLIAITLSSAACHTMMPVSVDQLGGMQPARVWVTRADGSVVVVAGPRALGDTLVGYVDGKYQEIPAADLKQMLMRRAARGRTAALIAGGALGFAVMASLLSDRGTDFDPCAQRSSDCDPNNPYGNP